MKTKLLKDVREAIELQKTVSLTIKDMFGESSESSEVGDTIMKALRFMEKCFGEPSLESTTEGAAEMWKQTKSLGFACGGHDQATAIFKEMVQQALKEVEDGNS